MRTKRYFQQMPTERYNKPVQSLPVAYTSQSDEGDEGGLDLGQMLAALRRRSLVIVSLTIAVASAALAQALTSTPTYEAKFELLIEPLTVENKLTSSPLGEEKQSDIVGETELKVLQSPKLISPILKQIQARYPSSGSLNLNFSIIKQTNILEVGYQDSNPEKVEFVLDLVSKAYLIYSLEDRRADVRKGIQFVEEQLPQLRQQVETLQEQLQKFRQRYDLIDPTGRGQQLSNQLNEIVSQRLETQTQLAKTRSLYTSLQNQLGLEPNEAAAALALSEAPTYQALLNQLQELETKIALESARYSEDSPSIQHLRVQQQNLLPLVEQERLQVLGNKLSGTIVKSRGLASPNSIRLQQMQQLFDAANQIQGLEAQNQALGQAESLLRQQFKQFPVLTRQNNDLERQLKIAEDNLNQFLTKREALRIDIAQKQTPWQLLTPPTNPQASIVDVKRNLILGTALGLFLGIGVALLVDRFNNVFYKPEEVKDTTRLPVLGEIPFKQELKTFPGLADIINLRQWLGHNYKHGKNGKPSQQHNVSQFWESLRSLYTNIRFISFGTPVRSLSIISAMPEDGRSTIALHLAQTAALTGQRVLLVDADLRIPKLHTMLGLSNTKGLSNIIAEDINFQDVIQPVNCVSMQAQNYNSYNAANEIGELPLEDIFFVLTAGQIPPNPTNLLSSQKMQNLAEEFQAAFDLIIYDTPPILGFADSSLLAVHTDASVLVVGLGKTNRSALTKALEGLKLFSNPVLGVVTNGVKG